MASEAPRFIKIRDNIGVGGLLEVRVVQQWFSVADLIERSVDSWIGSEVEHSPCKNVICCRESFRRGKSSPVPGPKLVVYSDPHLMLIRRESGTA